MSVLSKQLAILISITACALAGCSSVGTSSYQKFSQNECNFEGITIEEPQRLRFEVVRPNTNVELADIDSTDLEGVTILGSGQQSMVFDGATTHLNNDPGQSSRIWILASLGKSRDGNMCIETRTATRHIDANAGFGNQTLLTEETHKIGTVGACGEFFLKTAIPGANSAYLRISTAPKSTAEYLNNPGAANNSSCAQMVESLPSDSREQLRHQLRTALGV